jgi:hypothetical protein
VYHRCRHILVDQCDTSVISIYIYIYYIYVYIYTCVYIYICIYIWDHRKGPFHIRGIGFYICLPHFRVKCPDGVAVLGICRHGPAGSAGSASSLTLGAAPILGCRPLSSAWKDFEFVGQRKIYGCIMMYCITEFGDSPWIWRKSLNWRIIIGTMGILSVKNK